jgi:hypothetical protein
MDGACEIARPPLGWRIVESLACIGISICGLIILIVTPTADDRFQFGIPMVAVGLVGAVRMFRAGIILRPDELTVRGFVYNRTIRRDRITSISERPAIAWRDDHNITHETIITSFLSSANAGERRGAFRQSVVLQLRDWMSSDNHITRENE